MREVLITLVAVTVVLVAVGVFMFADPSGPAPVPATQPAAPPKGVPIATVVGDETHDMTDGFVARVPAGTNHGVILEQGEEMEYIYFNAFKSPAALQAMLDETN